MDERERRYAALDLTNGVQDEPVPPPTAARRGRPIEFTAAERRRLAFLRWLYERGRLTEWPARR